MTIHPHPLTSAEALGLDYPAGTVICTGCRRPVEQADDPHRPGALAAECRCAPEPAHPPYAVCRACGYGCATGEEDCPRCGTPRDEA